MWSLLLLLFLALPDLVAPQGDRLILRGGETPCEGYIEIFHDRKWGIVGSNKWSSKNSEVVCRSIGCGKVIKTVNILKPQNNLTALLDDVVCDGTEDQLWKCKRPCWQSSVYLRDTVKKITCSDKIDFRLDDFPCAGPIQYTRNPNRQGYICLDSNAKDEAQRVCDMLNCGKLTEISDPKIMVPKVAARERKKLKCTGTNKEQHLWQCAVSGTCESPTYIKCSEHHNLRLQAADNLCAGNLEIQEGSTWKKFSCKNKTTAPDLWCKQMRCGTHVNHTTDICATDQVSLTCSDTVSVTLGHNKEPNPCHGQVHINVNNTLHRVCGSDWDKSDGEVVCREQGCGKLMYAYSKNAQTRAILDNVKCSGKEASLWHCEAKYDSNGSSCGSTAYVVCAESLQVELRDGPGKCAGRLELKLEGQWWQVDESGWEDHYSDTVCRHLGCGNARNSTTKEKFSLSSTPFLDKVINCKPGVDKLGDCITGQTKPQQNAPKTPKTIICENHKVLFLRGSRSCSGMVGIVQGDNSYWLSGSNETWTREMADMVCRQMHCGTIVDNTSSIVVNRSDSTENLGMKTYQCNSTHENLFDCVEIKGSTSSDRIAYVTCSSETKVALENKCWGKVNMTVEGKSGGVCADTWSKRLSEMLCENLNCGSKIVQVDSPVSKGNMIVKSLHLTKHTKHLSESNLVLSDTSDFFCVQKQAYVVCSGSVETKFSDSRDHCSGNLMMTIENQEHLVCKDALKDTNVQNIICGQLGCGKADAVLSFFGPTPGGNKRVTKITCDASSKSLAECSMTSKSDSCTPVGLKCSGWRRMEMKLDDQACKGHVFVRGAAGLTGVSSKGWTEKEGKMLCENLGCGSYKNFSSSTEKTSASPLTTFNCTDVKGEKRNIWECQQKKTGKKQLSVTCDGEPVVKISDIPNRCFGEVLINQKKVCDSHWNINHSHIVCKQLGCGNARDVKVTKGGAGVSDLTHVTCLGHEDTLGQCKTVTGRCSGQPVSVFCEDAVELNTTETCGGQIKLRHRGQWESVCPLNKNYQIRSFKSHLCEKLNCGSVSDDEDDIQTQNTNKRTQENMQTSLIYSDNDCKDLKSYIHDVRCENREPAEIYCSGYTPPPERTAGPPVKLIVGVSLGALFLILVILLVFVLRRRYGRKFRPKYSADIEDLEDAEMPETRHLSGRGSERAVVKEYDTRSASSVYDDIDEGDEAASAPLTAGQRPAAAEPGATNNNAPSQSAEDITYEVDTAADGYDDIGVEGEVEVHDIPETKPENSRELPPVPGEEDYMEPDQDRHLKLE